MAKKIGEGHAAAMGRQGLKELRGAVYPDSNVAQQPEYGLYGTQTPGEVAEARRDEDRGSVLGERLKEAKERSAEMDREDRDLDFG